MGTEEKVGGQRRNDNLYMLSVMRFIRIVRIGALTCMLLASVGASSAASMFSISRYRPLPAIREGQSLIFDTDGPSVEMAGHTYTGVFAEASGVKVAVFCFSNVTISADVAVKGKNPIMIGSASSIALRSTIDISGTAGTATAGGPASAGGYAGGIPNRPTNAKINGPGHGGYPTGVWQGGGGAGYGNAGGQGVWGPAGRRYGSPAITVLWGGSGGSAGRKSDDFGGGGAGGGAIALSANKGIELFNDAAITADGGDGYSAGYAGGGGSGGAILITAKGPVNIHTGATISVRGGAGGKSAAQRSGGGGSGGRVAVNASSVVVDGTVIVSGGTRGPGDNGVAEDGLEGTMQIANPHAPRVIQAKITRVEADSAIVVANLIATKDCPTRMYIYWDDEQDAGTNAAAWAHADGVGYRQSGAFALEISDLKPGATYHARFYAVNDRGEGTWSRLLGPFTTIDPVEVATRTLGKRLSRCRGWLIGLGRLGPDNGVNFESSPYGSRPVAVGGNRPVPHPDSKTWWINTYKTAGYMCHEFDLTVDWGTWPSMDEPRKIRHRLLRVAAAFSDSGGITWFRDHTRNFSTNGDMNDKTKGIAGVLQGGPGREAFLSY